MIYEVVKKLADKDGISIRQLERNLNFSNGTLNKWKENPPISKVNLVANYFGVSIDYILKQSKVTN